MPHNVPETNPAAVSSAPSAPLDQEYGTNMNAPRTAQSADMQKDDMGGEAMDTEMNHEEDTHYGKYTNGWKCSIRIVTFVLCRHGHGPPRRGPVSYLWFKSGA